MLANRVGSDINHVSVEETEDGRGRCLCSSIDARVGDVLLFEMPLFREGADWAPKIIGDALRKLPADSKNAILELWRDSPLTAQDEADIEEAARGEREIADLMRAVLLNSIGTPGGGNAVYSTLSRINHSCRPNAAFRVRPDGLAEVVASRPIAAGEEICVSYLPDRNLLVPASQRAKLLANWGFKCGCPRCSGFDDTRTMLCPACHQGFVQPPLDAGDGADWSHCDNCDLQSPAEEMCKAEAAVHEIADSLKNLKGNSADRQALRAHEELEDKFQQQLNGNEKAYASQPVPDGHYIAVALAQRAADAYLYRGDYAKASDASRWAWRYAKRALAGARSRVASEALATQAASAAFTARLGRVAPHARPALERAAKRRYLAAIRELEPIVWPEDEQLVELKSKASLLKQTSLETSLEM